MASQFTKYVVKSKGGPLVAIQAAKPTTLGPSEVLVRVNAIAINPADCKMIDQGHRNTSWPLVSGLDGAGVVEAVGSEVETITLGDRVIALFQPGDRGGSFQEYAVVQDSVVSQIPTRWSFEDAASLG